MKNSIIGIIVILGLLAGVFLLADRFPTRQASTTASDGFVIGQVFRIGDNDLTLRIGNSEYLVRFSRDTEVIRQKNVLGKLVPEAGSISEIEIYSNLKVYYSSSNQPNNFEVIASKIEIRP